jgi:hypothetical protein
MTMMVYLVKIDGENKGQFFSTKEEAEKNAEYLNSIPNGVTYSVDSVEV